MDEDDLTVDPVLFLTEELQRESAVAGPFVIGYEDQERREEWLAAVARAAELIGCPVEVIDSGFFEDGFGHLRIRRTDAGPGFARGPGHVPQHVIDTYEAANQPADQD